MFEFVLKTENIDGIIVTRKFDTASDFLAACESDDINIAVSMNDPIISASYGYNEIDISMFDTVDELYCWMCSNSCEWFN